MAEVSDNAAILIATSFQAMERARIRIYPEAERINLLIALVFLSFYLEENLNVIIKRLNKDREIHVFFNDGKGLRDFGLLNKFGWFYNYYIAPSKLKTSNKSFMNSLLENLESEFSGFEKIYKFRNPVTHGKIEHSLSFDLVYSLREQAKNITDKLLKIVAEKDGVVIEKNISYKAAFSNFDQTHPAI